MKQQLKNEILQQMLPYLNNEQLSRLDLALDNILTKATVCYGTPASTEEEENLTQLFVLVLFQFLAYRI